MSQGTQQASPVGSYDYTRDDPGDPDNYVLSGFTAPTASADDIERANSFHEVPPGDHVIVVKGFSGPPKQEPYTVFVDGIMTKYYADSIGVIFCLPGQPNYTVRDFFVLPPRDPREHRAYFEGKVKPEDKQGGFLASKFLHFVARLGFEYPPGGTLPAEALRLSNWKGRGIHATVEAGRDWTDREGTTRKGFPRIKLFSFRKVDGPVAPVVAPPVAPQAQPAVAVAAPASRANVVLDNL